ncbi:DUF2120 domain-containing protein [Methanobrevibacter sp. OttesenSCG-928-K11]|nr:DUF2120 domain-containing protein [Methanobrevibacter sp. OttesenSCG-928-K11]MDL2271371.1 DUF2120 domain-containing protein [Methanobrevibacter sp. OttesenSCG-928-I08]
MVQLHKTAGKVMEYFESFKGSRPAFDGNNILVVRGLSRQDFPLDEMDSKLEEVGKIIEGEEVNPISDAAKNIMTRMDEQVRSSVEVKEAVDSNGFMRMKKDLENMGLEVGFKIFSLKHSDAIIAIWKDKNGIGPLYVEITISDNGM